MENHIIDMIKREIKRYKKMLFPHLPQSPESKEQSEDSVTTNEDILKITLHALKEKGQRELANKLEKCKKENVQ